MKVAHCKMLIIVKRTYGNGCACGLKVSMNTINPFSAGSPIEHVNIKSTCP